jgi:hypothetical protein
MRPKLRALFFFTKKYWATFWAIFSPAHPVALQVTKDLYLLIILQSFTTTVVLISGNFLSPVGADLARSIAIMSGFFKQRVCKLDLKKP